ncbi:glycosyltransferase family 2 protein [Halobellus marinus]|uniref:glycosyltransferase n=1 Tax=Halobellus TaxID=1073986 RepID=UPI0028AAD51D|nr:glycosyltransferase [Halobellus sp. DFY28]
MSTDRAFSTVNAATSGWSSEDFPAPESELPFVSVVVPVYNDPAGISATLDSLVRQSYSSTRHEVVVVDDGSTDRTPSVVQEYSETFEAIELVIEDGTQGSYAARNRGIRATSGPVVAFIDADMIVGPRWIEGVARAMAASNAEYLACDVELFSQEEEGIIAKYNRLNDLHVERFIQEQMFAPSCCLVVRRTVFEELGLFDPRVRLGGDFEFGNRVHDDGRQVEYRPELRMYHPTRTSLAALLRKAVRVGRGKTQLRRHYPDRYGSPLVYALNPLAFLPPAPGFLKRSIREWSTLSVSEKLIFALLSYLTALATAYGQLREIADPTDTNAVDA